MSDRQESNVRITWYVQVFNTQPTESLRSRREVDMIDEMEEREREGQIRGNGS